MKINKILAMTLALTALTSLIFDLNSGSGLGLVEQLGKQQVQEQKDLQGAGAEATEQQSKEDNVQSQTETLATQQINTQPQQAPATTELQPELNIASASTLAPSVAPQPQSFTNFKINVQEIQQSWIAQETTITNPNASDLQVTNIISPILTQVVSYIASIEQNPTQITSALTQIAQLLGNGINQLNREIIPTGTETTEASSLVSQAIGDLSALQGILDQYK